MSLVDEVLFGVFVLWTSVKCFLDVKVRLDGHMDPSLREHQSFF